ncbi:MAG: hypothetical protein ACP5RH_14660, partial [Leptodesmis sp.]|uniref:hypothetical protein n=1 Tax=Leptodesmis sp. TaxID=3100501 RepID=UPI003D0F115E
MTGKNAIAQPLWVKPRLVHGSNFLCLLPSLLQVSFYFRSWHKHQPTAASGNSQLTAPTRGCGLALRTESPRTMRSI